MLKFVILMALLVACVSAAPGVLVASAPAVAVHPIAVSSSYSNTYRAPVVKAATVVAAAPVLHAAPLIKATPLIPATPIIHAPATIVKSAPLIAHAPIAVAHAPIVAPLATSYAHTYKGPLVKSHVVAAAPLAIVH